MLQPAYLLQLQLHPLFELGDVPGGEDHPFLMDVADLFAFCLECFLSLLCGFLKLVQLDLFEIDLFLFRLDELGKLRIFCLQTQVLVAEVIDFEPHLFGDRLLFDLFALHLDRCTKMLHFLLSGFVRGLCFMQPGLG